MNKIYRIIWNSTLMQWVVTSELGRGKVKSASSKALSGIALAAIVSGSALGANACDDVTLTCDLGSSWTSAANNFGNGSVTISDGKTYDVKGPDLFKIASGSQASYSSINDLINANAGYLPGNTPLISDSDKKINHGTLSKIITVTDKITGSSKTVAVYDSTVMSEWNSGYSNAGFAVMRSGSVDVYAKSRFVTVTSGVANIDAGTQIIGGGVRDTQFVFADGTGAGTAQANWVSKNEVKFQSEVDFLAAPTQNYAAQKDTYNGTFTTFNSSSYTVNSLAEFQNYNNWLIAQLGDNKLDYDDYKSELAKAYTSQTTNYVINKIPTDADTAILNTAPGMVALLYGKGPKATVELTSTGRITGDPRGVSGNSSVFRLEDRAIGINNGEIEVGFFAAKVQTGSTFTNKNRITAGVLASGIPANGIDVHGSGSKFINDGVLNINPAYWSGVENNTNYGLTLTAGAEGVNNHVINAGITEGNKGRNAVGNVQAVRVNGANSTFTNASGGHINIGFAENGDLTYVKPGSYGIYAYGASQVDNQGTITLGSKVEGSSAIYTAKITNGGNVTNSGSIIIAGDGDKGNFTPQTNTGILAVDNSRGVYNTGTIDITGVNAIGIKTLSGGQVVSSGTINITGGADPSTGLRNYGAWSEGVNSLVDIANTVNLKG